VKPVLWLQAVGFVYWTTWTGGQPVGLRCDEYRGGSGKHRHKTTTVSSPHPTEDELQGSMCLGNARPVFGLSFHCSGAFRICNSGHPARR
jgi:hypothetical protein